MSARHMNNRVALLALILAVLASLASPVAAQVLGPPELTLEPGREDASVVEARRLNAEGRELVRQALFEQAVERFRASYLQYADPRLLLALGAASQRIPDLSVEAIEYYRAFEDAMVRIQRRAQGELEAASFGQRTALEQELGVVDENLTLVRGAMTALREALRQTHGQVLLDVSPEGAEMTFNGYAWPQVVSERKEMWLPHGSYEVSVAAAGRRSQTVWIEVGPERPATVAVRLETSPDARTGGILVASSVPGSQIRISGRDATSALQTPFLLAPGTYDVVVSAPGHEDLARSVTVDAGQTVRVAAMLSPVAALASDALAAPPEAVASHVELEEPPSWTRSDTGWTLVGAGGALLVAGSVMHGVSYAQAGAANERDVSCPGCLEQARADYESAKGVYAGALVGYGAGAAAVAAGAVLLLLDIDDEPAVPDVGAAPLDGGAFVQGRWRF